MASGHSGSVDWNVRPAKTLSVALDLVFCNFFFRSSISMVRLSQENVRRWSFVLVLFFISVCLGSVVRGWWFEEASVPKVPDIEIRK